MVKALIDKMREKISGVFIYHIVRRLGLFDDDPEASAKDAHTHYREALLCHIPPSKDGSRINERIRGEFTDRFSRLLYRGLQEDAKAWKSERMM